MNFTRLTVALLAAFVLYCVIYVASNKPQFRFHPCAVGVALNRGHYRHFFLKFADGKGRDGPGYLTSDGQWHLGLKFPPEIDYVSQP